MTTTEIRRNEIGVTDSEHSTVEYCPKCHGVMFLESDDRAGYYRSCLNCGFTKYLSEAVFCWNVRRRRWEHR